MLRKTFVGGKMNLDVDNRLLPEGEYREATNFDVLDAQGEGAGKAKNSLGNTQVTSFDFGANPVCIGSLVETSLNKIYWWVKSDTLSAIMEWDEAEQILSTILLDDRPDATNVLNFSKDYLITGRNIIIDSNNDKVFLFWVDNNGPRGVNIATAKSLPQSAFEEKDIMVIKAPPVNRPELVLSRDTSQDNYIEEELLYFAYRYVYDDDQYSALSPFSEVAFEPGSFSFDYATSTSNSMVNKNNVVQVKFNTGDRLVRGIDIIFKKSNSNTLYLAESLDKAKKGLANNTTSVYNFTNNKTYGVIAESQLLRLYDQVPVLANAQEVIQNRLVYGDYTIGFDLVDASGNNVLIDYFVELVSTNVGGDFAKSLKSIRDYEIGLVYKGPFGRATTVLVSERNTLKINAGLANMQNKIKTTINHLPPAFATHYNFYIKQSQYDYDVLSPAIFYQDGVFVWIKIEGGDINKIKQGDFLYVKSDTSGLLENAVQTEVLDIQYQEKNFLEAPDETEEKQAAGTYFKIKPIDFNINQNAASFFNFESYGFESRTADRVGRNSISGNISYIEDIIYKDNDLNDASSGGTFSGTEDKRITVEIFSEGTPDTFRWSDNEGATWNDNGGAGFALTGAAQTIVDGIQITFLATTGHTLGDQWVICARASQPIAQVNNSRYAWSVFQGKTNTDESIGVGAQITLDYHERRDDLTIVQYRKTFISSQLYANIEEWFYGDNIISQIEWPSSLDNVYFRRGFASNDSDPPQTMVMNESGHLFMLFRGKVTYSGGERINIPASIDIVELDNPIIMETKPPNINSETYFEHGKTYFIENGFHLGDTGDVNQSNGVPAEITLDVFNCFSFGNGFESYKIRDKFNDNAFKIDTKPSTTIERYGKERRKSGFIWSGVFQQTTNYNALNEFNAATINFDELDDQYGAIKKLFRRGNRLIAFQEDKITPIGAGVVEITDNSGNTSLVKSDKPFTALTPYPGEYGISSNPESFAVFGNRIYFVDAKRGVVCRLSIDGLTEISRYGLNNHFRNEFSTNRKPKAIGGYDPYHDKYVLSVDDTYVAPIPVISCGNFFIKYNIETPVQYIVRFSGNQTSLTISAQANTGSINVQAEFDGNVETLNNVTSVQALVIERTSLELTDVLVTITPNELSDFVTANNCLSDNLSTVKLVVLNDKGDYVLANGDNEMVNTFKVNGNNIYSQNVDFGKFGTALLQTIFDLATSDTGIQDGDTISIEAYSSLIADHRFSLSAGNRMGYLVTTQNYGSGQIDDILSAATFLTVNQVDGGGARTSSASFVVSKPSSNHIVYLIIDYSDLNVTANDDDVDIYNGDQIDINVIANDDFYGTPVVTITSGPSNGTAVVIGNQIRYTHDGSGAGSDTITYQLDNGVDTDTATVNITISILSRPPLPGGDPGETEAESFSISTTGYDSGFTSNGQPACEYLLNGTKYHDGAGVNPTLDDTIYNDALKTSTFDGLNRYYAIPGGRTIRINNNGRVTDLWICTAGGGGNA
jgi:hypothetical protein